MAGHGGDWRRHMALVLLGAVVGALLTASLQYSSRESLPRATVSEVSFSKCGSTESNRTQAGWDAPIDCEADLAALSRFAQAQEFITIYELGRLAPCCLREMANPAAVVDLNDVLVLVVASLAKVDRIDAANRTWLQVPSHRAPFSASLAGFLLLLALAQDFPNVLIVGEADRPDLGMVTCPAIQGDGSYASSGKRQLAYLQHLMALNDARLRTPYFLLVDDDSYVNADTVRSLLARINPACPLFMGYVFDHKWIPDLDYASGGGGILATRDCMLRALPIAFTHECPYTGFGDHFFARCGMTRGCQIVSGPGFNAYRQPNPNGQYLWAQVAASHTYHYMDEERVEALHGYLSTRRSGMPVRA